jgi:uncharacterized protein (DUF362 family)
MKPAGKIFIKPNAVFSSGYNPHAYTQPVVLQALIRVLKKFNPKKIILGEDCGLMVPTRYAFERAGYFKLIKKEKIGYTLLDEDRNKVRVPVTGTVHSSLLLPREWLSADCKIYVPKLKGHSQTTITNALKLPIGMVDRSERLLGHHYLLDEKIGDVALACQPDLVITDAVLVGQLGAGLPKPYPLGLLIIGQNPLSVDSVAASILGHNPKTIGHFQVAFKRGLGSIDLNEIEITGDVTLAEAQARAKDFEKEPDDANQLNPRIRFFIGRIARSVSENLNGEGTVGDTSQLNTLLRCPVEKIGVSLPHLKNKMGENSNLNFLHPVFRHTPTATAPGVASNCTGGCLGFAREAILFINAYKNEHPLSKLVQRLVNPRSFKPRTIALVIGDYKNSIPDEAGPILLVGDCARVDSQYRRRILKRLAGCPVFMGRSVFHFAQSAGLTNPYLDVKEGFPFLKNLVRKGLKKIMP